ncbi:MAG: tRNA (adenosine(37)-N6)-dimethylallyltransferase MiaA [Crocinitomicaceae bacterium]|nr:tRNA (adenosine(37)-N6)-dimethylallyltransferase MiaA [Crocinitomicaceae bacterium]
MTSKKKLIVIQGPTASGKTALGVMLAKHFDTEIISADSRQFYKEMAIGTAKPTSIEMDGVVHHFIDSHSILKPISAFQFGEEANKLIKQEFKTKSVVVVVGGSGLYIEALTKGFDNIPYDPLIKEEIIRDYKKHGLQPFLDELKKKDPEFYESMDIKNTHRVLRSVESIRISNKTMSELRNSSKMQLDYELKIYTLMPERQFLYHLINKRVDIMMQNGLLNEVKSLIEHRNLRTLKTVGYTELFAYLDGDLPLDKAVELIKQHTRNFAKRQCTWFLNRTESKVIPFKQKNEEKLIMDLLIDLSD